jgi:poly(3-hydroxybutyrate) depolymerase
MNPANLNYFIMEATRTQIAPMRFGIKAYQQWFESSYNPLQNTGLARTMNACLELSERITRKYSKPEFGISECIVDDKKYKIEQRLIISKPFCRLIHFNKIEQKKDLPKLLIVAPMAGHHATLLRGTVQETLPYFDVYITEWVDANQVPLNLGKFDMDDFINYTIEFMTILAPNLHVMAVCQPTVPVLAATSLMATEKDPHLPKSLILIGGPVDATKHPTKVNELAIGKSIEWFEKTLITIVPPNYPGYMRHVYPGFLQLAGFMSLDIKRHIDAHLAMLKDLIANDQQKADRQKNFYDEYLSTMDLTAEFYLQTIKEVFQDFSLAKGTLVSRNRKVDPKAINKCAILGIEGENDNIAGIGQTKAALNLCTNIPDSMKKYHLQKDVGHYGVFSGSKFKRIIIPVINDFVNTPPN